jgi:hypothetical protein
MNQTARSPVLARLDALVGEWTLDASFVAPVGVTGHATFEWVLGGNYLVERAKVPDAPDSMAIVGLNSDGETFTQHYFDSRGVTRLYAMSFDDGVWTLLRDEPDFSALDFGQRFTAEVSADGETISGRWEASADGSSWQHEFDLTYRKLP